MGQSFQDYIIYWWGKVSIFISFHILPATSLYIQFRLSLRNVEYFLNTDLVWVELEHQDLDGHVLIKCVLVNFLILLILARWDFSRGTLRNCYWSYSFWNLQWWSCNKHRQHKDFGWSLWNKRLSSFYTVIFSTISYFLWYIC